MKIFLVNGLPAPKDLNKPILVERSKINTNKTVDIFMTPTTIITIIMINILKSKENPLENGGILSCNFNNVKIEAASDILMILH